ncbi:MULTISPECIES: GNAT family protein [unclassified Kitasatospora]|uniref:GNAT family N-acetyltransferase n=1 Tax=unclassified Kitasatospora TaxID=2633591 RepID=UPI002E3397BF|nr:GNAT family protein [Kitasatospora sp. NBC_01246]
MPYDNVTLRPVAESELGTLEELVQNPEAVGTFQWFGWTDPGSWRRRWAENRLLGDDRGQLAVAAGGEFHGFVGWRRVDVVPRSYYWSMGIQLLPGSRGRGIGTRAQILLVDYLFAYSPVARVEADTETENFAEQRALEKAGFTQEGVLRNVVFRDGQWRDSIRYSVLRDEAAARRTSAES